MVKRKPVIFLLCVTVLAPIVLYTDRLSAAFSTPSSNDDFIDDGSSWSFGNEPEKLNALHQESINTVKEPTGEIYSDNSSNSVQISAQSSHELVKELPLGKPREHKSRALSAADEGTQSAKSVIEQVTERDNNDFNGIQKSQLESQGNKEKKLENKVEQYQQTPPRVESGKVQTSANDKQQSSTAMLDSRVKQLKDQLIRARVYQGLGPLHSNPQFIRELRARIRDVQRVLGDATKDSDLPKSANEKLKLMEQTLAKGKQMQDDCSAVVKKLRAMLHTSEEQLKVHKKQTMFLTQLAAKTLPKGLHCLPLRLSTEYYSLDSSRQQFPNPEKLEDPKLHHYALFSDNVLAASVVVNSTVTHAKNPADHVFHVVTDRLNYAAMRMWFLANPPGAATIQVQNVEEFTWLNESYSPVLKQLGSQSMIDYYFRTHRANSDSNLKFRNPKYLSILNHLRFYLPEIFPKLNKVVFLDDDIVVQKDLTGLWEINLEGKVNGAVETCGESFHRFDRYLNFSHPLIAKNFDAHACGWAYGMNVFDLDEWRKQNITEIYHSWQNLNHDRLLWKLGTLPPGLITFWKRTFPINRSWHVLGLGYNPNVNHKDIGRAAVIHYNGNMKQANHDRLLWKLGTLPPGLITFWKRTFPINRSWHVLGLGYNPNVNHKDIGRAAVIHYNGNMKPWLEIGMPKYRNYWSKYVDYDQVYLRECNITP